MRALLRNPLGVPAWLLFGIVLGCMFMGYVIPIFSGMMGYQIGRLAVLPALLVLGLLVIYDYKKLLVLIILLRSVGDKALENTGFSIFGMNMGIGGLINLAVIMSAALILFERPKLLTGRVVKMWLPILLVMTYGMLVSLEPSTGLKRYLGMLSYFSMFIIGMSMVRTIDDFNNIVKLVVASSLLPTLYSFGDTALNIHSGFRLASTFSHANILAFYLTLVLTLCLYMLKSPLFPLKRQGRVFISGYMVLLFVQLLLTQARSAWLAFFVIYLLYALFFERKYLLYLLVLPLIVALVPPVADRLTDLLQNTEDTSRYVQLNSFAWRIKLWTSAINWMEPTRLLYGYGLDGFAHYAHVFFEGAGKFKWEAHSVFVQFLFDLGALGLGLYLYLYGHVLAILSRFLRIDKLSGALLLAIVVQYLIVSMSDNLFAYLVFNWYFWIIVGGGCGLVFAYRDQPLNIEPPRATRP